MSSSPFVELDRLCVEFRRLAVGPVPRPVGGGIVVERGGRLAMIRGSYSAQGWHFPKGGLDEGESSLDAALKETGEEAGLEALPVEVPSLAVVAGTFRDVLSFGSPRVSKAIIYHPECNYFGTPHRILQAAPAGPAISLGAERLLEQAATALGMPAETFRTAKHTLFDALKDEKVHWRQMPTYHLLAFRAYRPELLTGESTAVRWWTLDELLHAVEFGGNVSKQVRQLLPAEGRATFTEHVRRTAEAAEPG